MRFLVLATVLDAAQTGVSFFSGTELVRPGVLAGLNMALALAALGVRLVAQEAVSGIPAPADGGHGHDPCLWDAAPDLRSRLSRHQGSPPDVIRAAALALALLAATPAAAADQAVHQLRASLPPHAVVKRLGPKLAGVVRAWIEDRQFPGYGEEDYLEVGGDRGLMVLPIRGGTVCYGAGVMLGGDALKELQGMVRR